jgi:hypothetical protein
VDEVVAVDEVVVAVDAEEAVAAVDVEEAVAAVAAEEAVAAVAEEVAKNPPPKPINTQTQYATKNRSYTLGRFFVALPQMP